MGSVDSWEQLSVLERKASRKLNLCPQGSNNLGQASEALEPRTYGNTDSNENFQVHLKMLAFT
jgi:hypothetical protein